MTFKDAIKKLGIEEYGERIFHSNSRGELMHLADYIGLAIDLDENAKEWFAPWFKSVVKWAEENWERPESVFQHVYKLLKESVDEK